MNVDLSMTERARRSATRPVGGRRPVAVGRRRAGGAGRTQQPAAHHVKLLEQAGVVERSRSEGDRRRTYCGCGPTYWPGTGPPGAAEGGARAQGDAATRRGRSWPRPCGPGAGRSRRRPRAPSRPSGCTRWRWPPPQSRAVPRPARAPRTSRRCSIRTTWWSRSVTTPTSTSRWCSVRDPSRLGHRPGVRACVHRPCRPGRPAGPAVHVSGGSDD